MAWDSNIINNYLIYSLLGVYFKSQKSPRGDYQVKEMRGLRTTTVTHLWCREEGKSILGVIIFLYFEKQRLHKNVSSCKLTLNFMPEQSASVSENDELLDYT